MFQQNRSYCYTDAYVRLILSLSVRRGSLLRVLVDQVGEDFGGKDAVYAAVS